MMEENKFNTVDFGNVGLSGQKYEISMKNNETAEDAEARRQKDAADASLKRTQSRLLFIFALILTSVVFGGCVVAFVTGSAEDKKWAASIVTGITTGLIGFLVGAAKK